MESTSTLCSSSSSINLFNPLSGSTSRSRTCLASTTNRYCRRRHRPMQIVAAARDQHYHSRSNVVDENMIVLRKRMHEMKMIERNYEPPEDWMEWEKRYYTSYDSIICDVVGVLQSQLMNTRPSLALGITALIMLSVPTSAAFVFFHFMEITKAIVAAGIHMV